MSTLVQADIFFFITSIAVIVIAALLTVALVYAILILRDTKGITRAAKAQSELILGDIDEARRFMRSEGVKLAGMVHFLGRLFRNGKRNGRKREASAEPEE